MYINGIDVAIERRERSGAAVDFLFSELVKSRFLPCALEQGSNSEQFLF